jgi:hypothetical protein
VRKVRGSKIARNTRDTTLNISNPTDVKPITALAHSFLATFHRNGEFPDGLAFREALTQANLDYTPESLRRVDRLLVQIRVKLKPTFRAFVEQPDHLNFLHLLCYYTGMVVSRYIGQDCAWYIYPDLIRHIPAEAAADYPECFASSIGCVYASGDFFIPLSAIQEILFEESTGRSLLASADQFMRRAVAAPVLLPSSDALGTPQDEIAKALQRSAEFAGFVAAFAISTSLKDGSALAPMHSYELASGQKQVVSLMVDDAREGITTGQQRLEDNSAGALHAVASYDGNVNLPTFRTDALILEVRSYQSSLAFSVAIPYRPANDGAPFALHSPRLVSSSLADARAPELAAALFVGINQFKPAGLWAAHFEDENSAESIAYRAHTLESKAPPEASDTIRLDHISIKRCVDALPEHERAYPFVPRPEWLSGDALWKTFNDMPKLLRNGKVVWAHIIQANTQLFKRGEHGHPAEIVYDPRGETAPQDLAPIAQALFALKAKHASLDANDPSQRPLLAIAEYLNAETARVSALAVPKAITDQNMLISSIYVERAHLPSGHLQLPYFPVLISEACAGSAMVLPSRWWPTAVLAQWQRVADAGQHAKWMDAWRALAAGRNEEDERDYQGRLKALQTYVKQGVSEERIAQYQQWGLNKISADADPPPFEWEWELSSELGSYAESVLREVEADRARGLGLNVARARNAFAARYTAQMIALHRLQLCKARGASTENIQLWPDEVQYAALGVVAGCEEAGLHAAWMLCGVWQRPEFYFDLLRPEVRFIFMLFASVLKVPLPPLTAFSETPMLNALLEDDRWCTLDAHALAPLCLAACEEHTRLAPRGPFQGLPIGIVLVFKLRAMRGLANPSVDHPLLKVPVEPFPESVSLDAACDELVARVRERMQRNGYQEAAIYEAVVTSVPLPTQAASKNQASKGGLNIVALIGAIVCFALMALCIRFFPTTTDRFVVLLIYGLGVLGFGGLGLGYVIQTVRSLTSRGK